jgi:hypothetical protein
LRSLTGVFVLIGIKTHPGRLGTYVAAVAAVPIKTVFPTKTPYLVEISPPEILST